MNTSQASDDVLITHIFPPPSPKRQKLDVEGRDVQVDIVDGEEPLRCSTPQPPGLEEVGENKLDTTLEELGISHDSIDAFIDETSSTSPPPPHTTGCCSGTRSEPTYRNNGLTDEERALFFGVNNEIADAFLREEEEEESETSTLLYEGGEGDGGGDGRGAEVASVPEIIEEILSKLPISHLFSSCRLVCHKWNDIIIRDKFLYWKKLYYRYKSGHCSQSIKIVKSLLQDVWSKSIFSASLQTTTLPLVRFVSDQFKEMEFGEETEERLVSHPCSHCVVRIRELSPSVSSSQGSRVVETAVLLVLCSRSVTEVSAVLSSLLSSSCKRVEIMEVFYCLALISLAGCYDYRKFLPPRVHYHLFYAINLSERSIVGVTASDLVNKSTTGQQSLHKYCGSSTQILTSEQAQIVNYSLQPGEVIKVMAFAGTGKTTTLLQFTALNPHMTFLYCVYNKSVQEHASTIFPANVRCRTFHSLAHGPRGDPIAVGWKYFSKKGSFNSYSVSQCVQRVPVGQHHGRFSSHVCQTIEKFIASGDDWFLDQHIPTTIKRRRADIRNSLDDDEDYAARLKMLNSPGYRAEVIRESVNVWKRMIDTKDSNVRITDDVYLKLFQLSKPQIMGYDCLLVDEAQDLTPAIISLVTSQNCAKVFVGDTHQQIYGFRGATNALEQISSNKIFHLTESFRFGPEIAFVAACTLSVLKDVWRQTLIGSTHPGRLDGKEVGQVAIIARMNATLFDQMVKFIRSGRKLKLGFAGGIQKYEFDMYLDLHKLLHGKNDEIKHKFVKRWKNFDGLVKFAEKIEDVSLINKTRICVKYRDLPQLIEKIKSMYSRNISRADIVFSTTHKSKGLEFDTVRLTDDYLGIDDDYLWTPGEDIPSMPRPSEVEESNLLYVAVTRAKKSLILSRNLARVLREAGEHFVYPTMEKAEQSEGLCSVCQLLKSYPPLHFQSLSLKVPGEGIEPEFRDGMVCTECSSLTIPFLHHVK